MIKRFRTAIGRRILKIYKLGKQKSFNSSLNHCINTARSMLKKSKYCFLITNSDKQWPSARMVQPLIDFDTFVIWLGTNPTLRKIKEIEKNPNVTLAFGNDRENANLIIYGKASIVRKVQERRTHWIGSWLLFFPSGPRGDDFVSIRIEPSEMELMNFKKSIVPEPFGLKPIKIIKDAEIWQIQQRDLTYVTGADGVQIALFRKAHASLKLNRAAAHWRTLAWDKMKDHLETQLLAILRKHPWFMAALDAVSDLGLPQWCIGAGVIRNIVFDYLEGRSTTPIRDVDVTYFDLSDLSEYKDREYESTLKISMPNVPWEVINQAAVHLWYHKKFGYRVPPVNSIEEAVATWPETCTAVAVTKLQKKEYKIYAPCGLEDLFGMVIRRNPARVDVRSYNARISSKQYEQCWKSVRIINEKV